jgi:hypothetical protein
MQEKRQRVEILNERDVFQNCVRAQINTSDQKECAYYATKVDDGSKVFVKGPYVTAETANDQVKVHAFKRMLCSYLPSINCMVLELNVCTDPDGMGMNFQNGNRNKWCAWHAKNKNKPVLTTPGYFLVFEDLLQPYIQGGELPTKLKTSATWPVPVKIVDFDRIPPNVFRHFKYNKIDDNSMYKKEDESIMRQYVLHVLFAWVCGCGADLADRNFFIHCNKEMYAVDLEAWAKFDWVLSDTIALQHRALFQMSEFINKQWIHIEPLLNLALENFSSEKGTEFFSEYDYPGSEVRQNVMKIRLQSIQTLDGVQECIRLKR